MTPFPFCWLVAGAVRIDLKCGCRLERLPTLVDRQDDREGEQMSLCAMHAHAAALVEALERLLAAVLLLHPVGGPSRTSGMSSAMIELFEAEAAAFAALRRARGSA